MPDTTLDTFPELKPIEQWFLEKKSDLAMFNIAKVITPGWGVGREVDEATYDAALQRAGSLTLS